MKKKYITFIVCLVLMVLTLSGCKSCKKCGGDNPPAPEKVILVTAKNGSVNIYDNEVKTFDYTTLFTITVDNQNVAVKDEYINSSNVLETPGSYNVICSYENKNAKVIINVIESEKPLDYKIEVSVSEVVLENTEVLTYNFNSLFTVTENGIEIAIKEDMVETDVLPTQGLYTYTVKIGNVSKTIFIKVFERKYELSLDQTEVKLNLKELSGYNFIEHFVAKIDGKTVEITNDMITSNIKKEAGNYTFTVTFNGIVKTLNVIITETIYEIDLKEEEINIGRWSLDEYDLKSYFTAKVDGTEIVITDDMISSNVVAEIGKYSFIVTNGNVAKTLIVNIVDEDKIEILKAYREFEIEINQLVDFDYTKLFSLYVNEIAVKVTADMIDSSELENPVVGNSYQVKITYATDKNKKIETLTIKVLAESELVITSKNIVTYPNNEYIDLRTLFNITKGDEIIPVTIDMISGSVDYSQIGTNTITITYQGITKKATVEVRRGVVINYVNGETVKILKGQNINTYLFANDFEVVINGLKFENIPENYFDLTGVDFNTVGTYPVKLTIPYNENKLSLSGVKFTYYEATINYEVVETEYSIQIKEELVKLPKQTTNYNVFNNLIVIINGKTQTLTENKSYADAITCYAKILSNPIDFSEIGIQEIEIAIYVNGVDNEAVIVSYSLIIESNVEIESINRAVFANTTVYAKDLFTIYEDGEEVEITSDMITGKIDTFTPGIYTVQVNYKNIVKEAEVIVYDNNMKGTYKTKLNAIPESNNSSDEEETPTVQFGRMLGDLVINEDGTITIDGTTVEVISGLDEKTMIVSYLRCEYTLMYVSEGIVVLEPDNSIRLGYNNSKRPMIYFNENVWTITNRVIINYSSDYVLNMSFPTYSIDAFEIKHVETNVSSWYGLMVNLAEKSSSDTIYKNSYGEVVFAENFEMVTGNVSSLEYNGLTYKFTMNSVFMGTINKNVSEKRYANMVFTGTVNGLDAELRADQYEGFTLLINDEFIFKAGSLEISSMNNGGLDYSSNILFVYNYKNDEVYSYKFILDPVAKTFTYIEKDQYFGLYERDNMLLFFDGYGMGEANFDTKSYYRTSFEYEIINNTVELRFINTKTSFEYSDRVKLYLDPFMNVLTATDFDNLNGKTFENSHITDGAIVRLHSYQVGKGTDTVAKAELYSNIDIITKDGILDDTAKKACIDTSKIRFNKAGFYQLTITINVNGEDVVSYYAIQILDTIYENNPIVGTYGKGVINSNYSLLIDKYGRVVLQNIIDQNNTETYNGMIKINDDNTFIINAKTNKNAKVEIIGSMISEGLIMVRCTGNASFSDYFTTGTSRVSGTEKHVLREITTKNETIYIYATSLTSMGSIITPEVISGEEASNINAILKLTTNNGDVYVKIISWEDGKNGLLISDNYRGTYTSTTSEQIVLDGFGEVVVGGIKYHYTLVENSIMVEADSNILVYKLNNKTFSFEKVEIVFDNSLISGKIFTTTHKFYCGSYSYNASTSFEFLENGEVIIKSTSSEHDEGDYMCESDLYEPSFASKDGVKGTYSVRGNKITINVGEETFMFTITNVINVDEIECYSTTVTSEEHGYFEVGTAFIA